MAWFQDDPRWNVKDGSSHRGPVMDTVHPQFLNEPTPIPNPKNVKKIAGVDGHETIVRPGWKLQNGVFSTGYKNSPTPSNVTP